MDDALVLGKLQSPLLLENFVLILVLMDDALVLTPILPFLTLFLSLNPCFNG